VPQHFEAEAKRSLSDCVNLSINFAFILSFAHFVFKPKCNLSLVLSRCLFHFICLISPSCKTQFVSEHTVPEQIQYYTVINISIDWKPGKGVHARLWTCLLCHDLKWRQLAHARHHEQTAAHRSAITVKSLQPTPAENMQSASQTTPAAADHVIGPLSQILLDLVQSPNASMPLCASGPSSSSPGAMSGMFEPGSISINGELAAPPDEIAISHLAESMMHWLDYGSVSSVADGLESGPASAHQGVAMRAEFPSLHMIPIHYLSTSIN